jgi:hypothetical protein
VKLFSVQRRRGNYKAAAIFGIDKSNIWLWWKHNAVIGECEVSWIKFNGPKKGQFPETDGLHVLFKMHMTGIHCTVFFLWHIKQLCHFSKTQLLTANLVHMEILIHIWFLAI